MRTAKSRILVACLVLTVIAPFAVAEKARHLGSTKLAKLEKDLDILKLPACKRRGARVEEVKLRAVHGQAEIEKLWVRFADGTVQNLDVRQRIGKGEETRWIDLNGGERCVREIAVIGDTELSLDKTRIDFFGR